MSVLVTLPIQMELLNKMENKELNILCPYCNSIWTAEMEDDLKDIGTKWDTCGNTVEVVGKLIIKCNNCKKVIYIKEIDEFL